jgi:hypothetical protein
MEAWQRLVDHENAGFEVVGNAPMRSQELVGFGLPASERGKIFGVFESKLFYFFEHCSIALRQYASGEPIRMRKQNYG